MKVLFICSNYYPVISAASNCVFSIIKELVAEGIECDVVNLESSSDNPDCIKTKHSKIYQVLNYVNVGLHTKLFKRQSLFTKCYVFTLKLINEFFSYPISRANVKVLKNTLNKIGDEYDFIVPVIDNFNIGAACMKGNKKYILYQVDPISTNMVWAKHKKKLFEFEKELYSRAFRIITTPILKKEKDEQSFDVSKIIPAQFPNVRNLTEDLSGKNDKIICSFLGYIYGGVRDCAYTLKLFSTLKTTDFCLNFAGRGQEELLSEYQNGLLHNKLEHFGVLNTDESINFLKSSNFLINIGNVMTNMVPSKLFDYISTGKPIINICENKDCPTIPYLERYGLALNLVKTEDESVFKEQVKKLEEFISENKGKQKDFNFVESEFKENTAKYVANQFINAFNDKQTAEA